MAKEVKSVERYLELHGIDANALRPSQLEQLNKVHDSLVKRASALQAAHEALKANKITVLGVAEDTGISRKTFYNNTIIKSYVEETAAEFKEPASASKDTQPAKVQELERQIRGFVVRDIESEKLKIEAAQLRRELMEANSRIKGLEDRLEKTKRELATVRKKVPADLDNVIVMPASTGENVE